ncbi:hypothetical protein FA15DRAFT_674988 [Coprinopsis marcescibilis]|uniref:Uncharacterized protein n=1 Tax=Coprinopsis marcescibilis TaxID=230819 RepID=A0A5C3KG03_COPMA|nr:hypothetical protein FA15DRAFT_674988 [Coprinopsis marcescibilis]
MEHGTESDKVRSLHLLNLSSITRFWNLVVFTSVLIKFLIWSFSEDFWGSPSQFDSKV